MRGAWPGRTSKSPSPPGTTTMSTGCETSRRSGDTSSKSTLPSVIGVPSFSRCASGGLGGHLARLLYGLFDGSHHVERRLGKVIVLAVHDSLEAFNRVLDRTEDAGRAGKDLRDVARPRQAALDLAGARPAQTVVLGPFVHSAP